MATRPRTRGHFSVRQVCKQRRCALRLSAAESSVTPGSVGRDSAIVVVSHHPCVLATVERALAVSGQLPRTADKRPDRRDVSLSQVLDTSASASYG